MYPNGIEFLFELIITVIYEATFLLCSNQRISLKLFVIEANFDSFGRQLNFFGWILKSVPQSCVPMF